MKPGGEDSVENAKLKAENYRRAGRAGMYEEEKPEPMWPMFTLGGMLILALAGFIVALTTEIGWKIVAVPLFFIASYLVGRLAWWLIRLGTERGLD